MELISIKKIEEVEGDYELKKKFDEGWVLLAVRVQEWVDKRDGVSFKQSCFIYSFGCTTLLEEDEEADSNELKNAPKCVSTFEL